MASASTCSISPCFVKSSKIKTRFQVRVQSLGSSDSTIVSSDSVVANGTAFIGKEVKNGALFDGGKWKQERHGTLIDGKFGNLKSSTERKQVKDAISQHLGILWADGYGTKTVKDYLDGAKEITKPDGGPPRWFCPVECGKPLKGSPVLLYLPGVDGVGLGLILHHKALGKVFEVRCLHIPVYDRTSFQGLVKFVEETVRLEHSRSPNKPIYLVGDCFGGCLALAIAARNPKIDLVLVLANPATSFHCSQLQPVLPILELLPNELNFTVPYLLSFVMGNPMKMAAVDIEYRLPPRVRIEQLSGNLSALIPRLSVLADIIPKETLLWKLDLIKSASAYANSRLHAVTAEVLVLASGNDYMLPSRDEAQRLKNSLQNCVVRYFKENGHTLLMEDGISLLTIMKGTAKYRRSRMVDYVTDYVPPSMSEFKHGFDEVYGLFQLAAGGKIFSTLNDGKIVEGLAGIPDEGPVLLVGYHMLMGIELFSLFEQFIREKNILLRGIAHPEIFARRLEHPLREFDFVDWIKVMGGVPVTPSNLFKLLSNQSHVLLYPGGAREALHYKGEGYKLFWPDQPEFVRMAAKFGATIVPFGVVGEDDIAEYVLDYHDLIKIPGVGDIVKESNRKTTRVRKESQGEVGNPNLFLPIMLPKLPGRFYFLFGKPIRTEGQEQMLKDKENANHMYSRIKSEVERSLAYLLKKREEDPYRGFIDRTVYRAMYSSHGEVPAFDP